MKNTFTTKDLKNALRSGPYTWPGAYPLYFIASDGEALSFAAVRENIRSIFDSMRNGIDDGWAVIGCEVNWEDPELFCAHSNARIESAYAEDLALS